MSEEKTNANENEIEGIESSLEPTELQKLLETAVEDAEVLNLTPLEDATEQVQANNQIEASSAEESTPEEVREEAEEAAVIAELQTDEVEELPVVAEAQADEVEEVPVVAEAAEDVVEETPVVAEAVEEQVEEIRVVAEATEQPVEALVDAQLHQETTDTAAVAEVPAEKQVLDQAGVEAALPPVYSTRPIRGAGLPGASDRGGRNKAPQATTAPAIDPAETYAKILDNAHQEMGGIEILINMAAKGEIDPKNIDIIDVTDRFLKAISSVPKENLRQSGKIIFQASVLLRLKAEALLVARIEDEFGFGDDYVEFDIDGSPIIFDSNHQIIGRQITLQDLERALVRQTQLRQMRHRRVTLEQLIEALREAERLEQTRGERKIKPRIAIDGYNEMRDMDDILDLAHDEDIEDVIARIERLLMDLLTSDNLLPLLRIIEALGGRGDWVDAFLAVLFLSNAGKIQLEQEEFYGVLYVTRPQLDASSVLIPPVVPADGPVVTH